MDLGTSAAYVAIVLLVAANAWIVQRLDVKVRRDDD